MKKEFISGFHKVQIRDVTTDDASALLDVYSPYVEDTNITFETEIPSTEDFIKRIEKITEKLPWLVAEMDGVIAGYAYASKFRDRAAYRWSVEFTVYIDPQVQANGVGRLLYSSLIEIVKSLGYYNAIAIISLPNEKSVKFHESAGFLKAGQIKSSGYKLGEWRDTGYWQLKLREYGESPAEPVLYSILYPAE